MIRMEIPEMLSVVSRMPDTPQVADHGALVAARERHIASALAGYDVYSSVTAKAAALLHSLVRVEALDAGVRNRPFAWLVAMRFLKLNDTPLPKVDPATVVEFLESVRQGEAGLAHLTAWLDEQVR